MTEMRGHEKCYYVADRSFSVPELKVMMDAIHGSRFITEKKSEELISKIASLGGSHMAELLKRNQTCFNTHRHSNESIYYSIDACEHALQQKRRLAFWGWLFTLGSEMKILSPAPLVKEWNERLASFSEG